MAPNQQRPIATGILSSGLISLSAPSSPIGEIISFRTYKTDSIEFRIHLRRTFLVISWSLLTNSRMHRLFWLFNSLNLTLESSADRPRSSFLGHGIFNADGTYWEHSRALIRPNFVRKQVGNLKFMEHHVMTMVNQLPGNGSRVNIQEFFFRMVCIASSTIFVIPFLGSFEDR